LHVWPQGQIDITGGTLIIDGDVTGSISSMVGDNRIVAYGGSGVIEYDYNTSNAGKTTVTAVSDPYIARDPSPIDNGETPIFRDLELSWTSGVGAISHDIYFSADFSDVYNASRLEGDANGDGVANLDDLLIVSGYWLDDPTGSYPYADLDSDGEVKLSDFSVIASDWQNSAVAEFKGNQLANSFIPDPLDYDTTYYWRVDEVQSGNIRRGNVWSFDVVEWDRPATDILNGFKNMYQPHVVVEDGQPYPFKMWFFGWATDVCNPGYSGCDAIFHARSQDLVNWEVWKGGGNWDTTGNPALWVPVLTGDTTYFDDGHTGDPSVVKRNGVYYMAYSATGPDLDGIPRGGAGDTDGGLSCVRGATSTDGINWTRSSEPLLIYEPEIGQYEGYETDPTYLGDFHRPSLMWDGDHWRIWFDYWGPTNSIGVCLGHAECYGDPMDKDDWVITNDLYQPLINNWVNPDVVEYNGTYYLFGDPVGYLGGVGWENRQTRIATSADGINWSIGPFFDPDPDVPTNDVPEAVIVDYQGHTWMYVYYSCQGGGDPYEWRYKRIRYMRKCLY